MHEYLVEELVMTIAFTLSGPQEVAGWFAPDECLAGLSERGFSHLLEPPPRQDLSIHSLADAKPAHA
jgi:hypothetical protein